MLQHLLEHFRRNQHHYQQRSIENRPFSTIQRARLHSSRLSHFLPASSYNFGSIHLRCLRFLSSFSRLPSVLPFPYFFHATSSSSIISFCRNRCLGFFSSFFSTYFNASYKLLHTLKLSACSCSCSASYLWCSFVEGVLLFFFSTILFLGFRMVEGDGLSSGNKGVVNNETSRCLELFWFFTLPVPWSPIRKSACFPYRQSLTSRPRALLVTAYTHPSKRLSYLIYLLDRQEDYLEPLALEFCF